MKLFFVALLSAIALVPPTALAQQDEPVRFTVGDATPPDTWAIDGGGLNSIAVAFNNLGGYEAHFSYTVDQSDCFNSNAVDIDATGGGPVPVSAGITVDFTNPTPPLNNPSFCFTVNLIFADHPNPVHTKTFTFDVDVNGGGSVTAVTAISNDNLMVFDAGTDQLTVLDTENRPDPQIDVVVDTSLPIFFDTTVALSVRGNPSYFFRIASIEPIVPQGSVLPSLDPDDVSLPPIFRQGVSEVTFKIPLDYFAAAVTSNQPLQLTLDVDWNVDGRRSLGASTNSLHVRGPRNLQESGAQYQDKVEAEVELVPLDGDGAAYEAKVVSMTFMTVGGAAAILFL